MGSIFEEYDRVQGSGRLDLRSDGSTRELPPPPPVLPQRTPAPQQTQAPAVLPSAPPPEPAQPVNQFERFDADNATASPSLLDQINSVVMQGATFGLSDEVAGAGRFAGRVIRNAIDGAPLQDGASEAGAIGRDAERVNIETLRGNHPGVAFGAEVAGGLAGVPVGAVTNVVRQGGGALSRLASAAKQGAAFGSVYGFGAGEGGFQERALNSGLSAATGALAGGGLSGLATLSNAVSKPFRTAFNTIVRPGKHAVSKTAEAFGRDGVTPARVIASQKRGIEQGVPTVPADVAGRNTKRLARAVVTTPSRGSDKGVKLLERRQLDQPERVVGKLRELFSGGNAAKTIDQLHTERGALGKRMYRKAFDEAKPVNTVSVINKIDELLETAGESMTPVLKKFKDGISKRTSLEALHNLKSQDLDDKISSFLRSGDNAKAAALMGVKKQLLKVMTRSSKGYKAANATYSGHSTSMEAVEAGRKFIREGAEETVEILRKMNPGDKDFYRMGAAEQLLKQIRNAPDGSSVVRRIFGTPEKRDRLKALFPDRKSYNQFRAMLLREGGTTHTNQFVRGNSATADKIAEQADAGVSTETAIDLARGDIVGAAGRTVGGAFKTLQGITPRTADEFADILFETDPAKVKILMDAIQRRMSVSGQLRGIVDTGSQLGAQVSPIAREQF